MKVLQYSYPRSGSTVVWNILEDLLSPENTENKDRFFYPANVIKTHDLRYFRQFYAFKGKIKFYNIDYKCGLLVSTIRHPITNCLSLLRVGMVGASPDKPSVSKAQGKEEVTNETITLKLQNYINHYEWMLKQLKEKSSKRNTILFDYDQQIKPIKPILNTLEGKLGILILNKEDKIKYFLPPTLMDHGLDKFDQQDNSTLMHGEHVKSNKYPIEHEILALENPLIEKATELYLELREQYT